jgi:hypothetical protein
MSITFKVRQRNGEYVRAGVVSSKHSDEPHFGWIDAGIITFFLLGVGALVYLLARN